MEDYVILLDSLANRYAALHGAAAAELRARMKGSPTRAADDREPGNDLAAQRALTALAERGWLSPPRPGAASSDGEPDVALPEASATLPVVDRIRHASIGPRRAFACTRSAIWATLSLRFRTMASLAGTVSRRNARLLAQENAGSSDVVDAVAGYLRIRPLLYSAHERCLFDSLALLEFLASEGIGARWVIGVRIRPFGAHAWLQRGSVVVNDHHERVRAFRPILVA